MTIVGAFICSAPTSGMHPKTSCWSKKDWKILPVMKGAQDLPKSIPNNTGKHVHIIENRAKRIRVCQQPAPAVLDTVNVDKLKK